ncbi:restriction endonuclease subunit S [Candidatus Accumulibacter sp. ACC003]|uniref:restriction endonuclease subunit S n=1 Tax=Candidatus Accumulibacter sp. ACC003 TaxID=2823334 RepID=UPI0025C671BE|nr:restriction endonuclease subunit S [Candidatus Accumulibacter sp. ACC003]
MSAVPVERPDTVTEGWRWTTMGEIAEVAGGGTPRTNDAANFENGDIPWLTPADLSGYTEKYIAHGARFITQKGIQSCAARLLSAGTVLFTSRAPIGYVAIARNPIATNQGFKSFVLHDGVLPEYVYWWLKGSKRRAESLANGTTFLELSGANAKKIAIPIAPLERQREIVAEIEKQFSRLDEAVANLNRVKVNLKRYKAAVLKAAMEGRLVEPATSVAWALERLEAVAEVQLGQQRAPVHAAASEQTAYVRAANVTWDGLDLSDVKFMGFPNIERYRLRVGDILLSEASGSPNEVGKPALWNGEIPNACYQKTLIRIRTDARLLTPRFVYYFFLHTCLTGQFARLAPGVGILHLTAERMLAWPTPVPPLAEQHRIVAEVDRRLSIVREVESEVDANLKRAQALRQATLAKAFAT